MKFSHLSDCHIGSWREPALRDASIEAFCNAIDISLSRGVSFIIISGDLFNTAQPGMEYLRATVLKLKACADAKVPVYIIAGSHDYSPSGKTMLDVLEAAGLCINVAKGHEVNGRLQLAFTTDPSTRVKITGMVGRKGSLERHYFELLDLPALEQEPGNKIFVFHSAVTELRPRGFEEVESVPLSLFPKGFLYYAGGHIHVVEQHRVPNHGLFGIPGPIFPNNFQELEHLHHGGFFIYTDGMLDHIPLALHPVLPVCIDAQGKNPATIEREIQHHTRQLQPGTIVTLRLEGVMDGGVSDIPWSTLTSELIAKGARCVLRNTSKLSSPELSPIQVSHSSVEEIEASLIREHAGALRIFEKSDEEQLIKTLMHLLSQEKGEGETVSHFEERLATSCNGIMPTP